MAKKKSVPSNISGALRCVKMVRQGKACSMADLKATVLLLDDARKTLQSNLRTERSLTEMLRGFLRDMGGYRSP